MDNKTVFAIAAVFLCLIVIVGVFMYYQIPNQYQSSETSTSQTQDQALSQEKQKTRIEYIVKVTTSRGHFGGILVKDENDNEVYSMEFENDDEATVTNEYKINAGAGDTVTVEVQFGGYVTVRLVKEGFIFNKTIASKTDYDGVIFRYTIKEDDV